MNNEISIRKPKLEDVKKLSIVYQTVYIEAYGINGVSDEFANFITVQFAPTRLEKIIVEQPNNILVAEYKNNLVGVAEIAWNKPAPIGDFISPELNKLYILRRFYGRNVGQLLLEGVEKIVLSKGKDQLWLWAYHKNFRAIRFYEKHHFKWIGNAFFEMEENKYENVVMVKMIN